MEAIDADSARLLRLAELRGIGDEYRDFRGEQRSIELATKAGLLRAMGFDTGDPAGLEAAIAAAEADEWRAGTPRVVVAHGTQVEVLVNLPVAALADMLHCSLRLEDGSRRRWAIPASACAELQHGWHAGREMSRRSLRLPAGLPLGYHDLQVAASGGDAGHTRLIIAPSHCHEPAVLRDGRRVWGVAVQLYTLRSARNWGLGDFTDLQAVVRAAAARGAAFVGLNPLHALFPSRPAHCSPYSPSSRHALNVLYIDVEAVPEFAECDEARQQVAEPAFQQRLAALRATAQVDHAGVAAAKLPVLERLYAHFQREHAARRTPRAEAFKAWCAERGRTLALHALYDALDEHCTRLDAAADGWQSWPADFREPGSAAVSAFATASVLRVTFYAWLQWLADAQLAAVRQTCRALDLPLGLYGDYAVGVNPGGSETWSDQRVYRMGAGIGAPPDALALKGQDWGIPPQDPSELAARAYQPFVELLRANLRHFGALRLDHVMALYRQWWVPQGAGATEGGYVHYPLEHLAAIVALESVRNGCLVVGEDLGTVPPEVGAAMATFRLYHYKVVLFEQAAGRFKPPGDYVRRSIATLTTHDLPTLRGWWEGADLELRDRLQLYPDLATRERVRAARALEREHLLDALAAAGLRPRWPVERFEPQFAAAVHAFLGHTASALAVVQAEDLAGMLDPVNVPGTSTEHPNWQRKMTVDIDALFAGTGPQAILDALAAGRGD